MRILYGFDYVYFHDDNEMHCVPNSEYTHINKSGEDYAVLKAKKPSQGLATGALSECLGLFGLLSPIAVVMVLNKPFKANTSIRRDVTISRQVAHVFCGCVGRNFSTTPVMLGDFPIY